MTRVHTPHDGALPRRITVLVEMDTDPLTDDEADEAAALAAAAVARLLPSSTSGDVRAGCVPEPLIETLGDPT